MTVSAGDWPGLRGSRQDGVAVDEQLADPTHPPSILWSRKLGQGYASFAISGNRAVSQFQTALGQYLICLDPSTGDTIWETRVGEPYELAGIYPGPRGTPAIHDGVVYFTTPDGEVGAANLAKGEFLWVKNLQEELQGVGTEFGYSASPIIADNRLYLPIGGPQASIVALQLPSGEIAWKSGSGPASYCSILPMTRAGHPLLAGYLQNDLVILDRATGKEMWKTQISGGYDEHSSMPVDWDPILVVSAPFQAGSTAYRVEWSEGAQEPLKVEQAWHQPRMSLDVDSATPIGDTVFGFDVRDPQSKAHRPSRGQFRCMDLRSGSILWSAPGVGQSNAVAVGNDLLLFNDSGELIRATVDRQKYQEHWRLPIFQDEVTWAAPSLSSGVVIVRSHELAVGIRVGEPSPSDPSTVVEPYRGQRWWPRLQGLSAWLLRGEREHPFMRPTWEELRSWYFESLAVLFPLLFVLVIVRRRGVGDSIDWLHRSLWITAVFGVLATPILNTWRPERFAFTWPLTLFALFQSSVLAARQVALAPSDRRVRLRSRWIGIVLLCVYLGCFLLLRQASLPHEWVFLMLPVSASPVAIWTARFTSGGGGESWIAVLVVLGFTTGFWGTVMIPQILFP
jgi:hypothetical protein